MTSSRFPTVTRLAIAVTGLMLVACELGPTRPSDDMTAEARGPALDRGALSADGAFLVGNFQPPFGSPTNAILRYDSRGNFVDVFVPTDMDRFVVSCCMTYGPDDNLYVASPRFNTVLRFNGATGEFMDEFVSSDGGIVGILIPKFGPDGNLYVGEFGPNFAAPSVRRYDGRTGAFIDVFVEPNAGGMVATPDPQDFTWGPDGHFYIAAPLAGKVLRFDGRTGDFIDAFVSNEPGRPRVGAGLAFGSDGYLYVGGGNAVGRYDALTGEFVDSFVSAGSGGLTLAVGLLFGPDGHLYVANATGGNVLRFHGKTGAFIDEFIPAGRGGINGPRIITFKMKMNVCHRSPGSSGQARTLSVGQLDAADHVGHGDAVGECDE